MDRIDREMSFGKIDYYGRGRRINEITLNVAIYYRDKNKLAISGNIWNGNHTDIICGGQCLDNIKKYRNQLKNKLLFDELYFYWKKYHIKQAPDKIILRVERIIEGDFEEDEESRKTQICSVFEIEDV